MIGQSQIIEKYNNLQGKSLKRSEVRGLIRQAKNLNIYEIVNKLTGLLRSFPNEKGFEFTRVTPVIIKDDFEALGIPYLSPEEEKEMATTEAEGLGKRVSNDDIYKMITNKFIKIIDESGHLPWDSGFNDKGESKTFAFSDLPINYASNKYYRGINSLVLSMYRYHTDETRGKISINDRGEIEEGITEIITDGRLFWLTFKQVKEAKGKLKKGSLSQQAIFYNWVHFYDDKKISEKQYNKMKKMWGCSASSTSDNCKKLKKFGFLRYYNVFNERDIENIDFEAKRSKLKSKSKKEEVKTEEQKLLAADLVLKHMPNKPKLQIKFIDKNKDESPYYSPSLDKVVMPQKNQFNNLEAWYGVAFHEHIHATGHAKRTDRRSIKGFTRGTRWGDTQYAIEELVAEIGSAFLNAESGILLNNLKNNAAYIKGWARGVKKYLKKDHKAIFVAAGQSQKAADYILDFNKDGDPAYWKEYQEIQKEIKAKGKKQAEKKDKCPKEAIIKHLKAKSREDFANDYAYIFSADLDRTIAWVEDDDKVYKKWIKALADKVCKEPIYLKVIDFKSVQSPKKENTTKNLKELIEDFHNSIFDELRNFDEFGKVKKYKLGERYKEDFPYKGMLEYGLTISEKTAKATLIKLYDSFVDVNYHDQTDLLTEIIKLKDVKPTPSKEKLKITNHTFRDFNIAINHTYKLFTIQFLKKPPYPISNYLKNDKFKSTSPLLWQRKIGAWGDPQDRLDILASNILGIFNKIQKDIDDQKKREKERELKEKKEKETDGIITTETIQNLVEEFKFDKKTSFRHQLEYLLKGKLDMSNPKDVDIYRAAIKMFLEQKKYTKLNKKQAIEIDKFGTLIINPLLENMVKPKKMNFRDTVVMMNKEVAGNDPIRPVMMHVLHENVYLIGTDAHALSKIKTSEKESKKNIVYDAAGRKHNDIGKYPNYNAVIPRDNSFVSSFNLKELMMKLKGIVKAQNSVTDHGLHGVIVFEKKDIYFNPAIMLRSLTPLYKNGVLNVNLYVGEPNRAIIFKDDDNNNQLALCMPVMGGFDHKIVASIYGNYTDGDRGLKGFKKKGIEQLALFGYVQTEVFTESSDIKKSIRSHDSKVKKQSILSNRLSNDKNKKKTNTNKKGLKGMEQKKTKKYKSKYNQDLLNQLSNKHNVSIDFIRKALSGTRKSNLSFQIKDEYNNKNTSQENSNNLASGLNDPVIQSVENIPVKAELIKPIIPVTKSLVKGINHVSDQNETFEISGDIGNFLGRIEKKPVGSVACTLDAPQGAGKTRFFFQIMNELAKKYKVLFISLEEHPQSSLFKEKVAQYIEPENQNNIDTVGELERGKETETLNKLIPNYDIVFVDSWNKIFEAAKLDFDNDLRKAYNGKLIFAIFQRTVTGTMRGGAKAQFDGDIIMKIEKGDDFKENIVYHDKNRYQNKDLTNLHFNIFKQRLEQSNPETKTVNIPIKIKDQGPVVKTPEPVAIWDDATITI